MKKWPQLLVDIEKLIDAEVTPDSDGAKHLAQQWLSMLQGYAGKNPSTQEKIRTAMQSEPGLADGTWPQTSDSTISGKSSSSTNAWCLVLSKQLATP